ncbi:MAG: SMC-Scp complex subunit ScpB [Candidatus Aenigmatarchaeota archaeon]
MEMRNIEHHLASVEAILFATPKPLSLPELAKLAKLDEDKVRRLLSLLRGRYQDESHGIMLSEVGGYRLMVKQEHLERVASFTKSDLSKGLLRVLSIIAYHEPVKQSDIVKIIGNRTYEYVKQLEKLGFVKFERKAKTKLLTTTPHFESYFSLNKEQLKKALAEVEKSQPARQELHKEGEQAEQKPPAEPQK